MPAGLVEQQGCVASGATSAEMAARCRFIAAVLHQGRISPTALPSLGQMAPKM